MQCKISQIAILGIKEMQRNPNASAKSNKNHSTKGHPSPQSPICGILVISCHRAAGLRALFCSEPNVPWGARMGVFWGGWFGPCEFLEGFCFCFWPYPKSGSLWPPPKKPWQTFCCFPMLIALFQVWKIETYKKIGQGPNYFFWKNQPWQKEADSIFFIQSFIENKIDFSTHKMVIRVVMVLNDSRLWYITKTRKSCQQL